MPVVVQSLSHVWLFVTPWTAACQASLSFTISWSSNSCPFSWWCHPTISLSLAAFFSCLQSFPASGSFLMNLMRHNDMPRCIFFEICHSWCWLSFLNLWLIFVINFGLSKLIRIVSHYSFLFFFSLSLAPPIECMLHFLYLPHSCWIVYSIFPLCFFQFGYFLLTYLQAYWFFHWPCPVYWWVHQRHSLFLLWGFWF